MGGADATPAVPVAEVTRIAERLVIGGGTVHVVEVGGTGAIEGDSITNRATVGPIRVCHRSIVHLSYVGGGCDSVCATFSVAHY
jgi:hypothetical protein